MTKAQLLTLIETTIKSNGVQQITGDSLNYVLESLLALMPSLQDINSNSQFLGTITTASTIPADGNVWGFAGEGTYLNAGNITVAAGKFAILSRVGTTWSKVEIPANITQNISNNTYNLDPAQIVPSEALYTDDTLAGDILKRVDKNTGENINYKKHTFISNPDGVLFKNIGNETYIRIFENKQIDVRVFKKPNDTSDADAIQRAIDASGLDLNVWKRGDYSIYLPERGYVIDKPIVIRNREGLIFKGASTGSTINIAENTHLDSMFILDGIAYCVFEDFSIGGLEGSSCDYFFHLYWGNKIDANNPTVRRSNTQNIFKNIRNISGKFKYAVYTEGVNQVDMSSWYECSFNGVWDGISTEWYQGAVRLGDGDTGNNLLHNFYHCYMTGCESGYQFNGVGGMVIGGGMSNMGVAFVRNGVNETLKIDGVRLEGCGRIYQQRGYLNGIHQVPDNITLQNVFYSGLVPTDHPTYFQPAEDGILIFHGGGNMNLIGCTITNMKDDNSIKFKLSGAMDENFHNSINIIGCNIQAKFNELFIVDTWANASVSVIGSNEITGDLGTMMGNHVGFFQKDFNYISKPIEHNLITNVEKSLNIFSENKQKGFRLYTDGNCHISATDGGFLFIEGFNRVVTGGIQGTFYANELSDSDAYNGMIYFSTTNNKLCFKDFNGIINVLY